MTEGTSISCSPKIRRNNIRLQVYTHIENMSVDMMDSSIKRNSSYDPYHSIYINELWIKCRDRTDVVRQAIKQTYER